VQELADGLNRLLYDYGTAVKFGRQGRKKLEEEFSFDSYLQKLCGVLGRTQHEDPKEEAQQ
jgi:hypothetical protein